MAATPQRTLTSIETKKHAECDSSRGPFVAEDGSLHQLVLSILGGWFLQADNRFRSVAAEMVSRSEVPRLFFFNIKLQLSAACVMCFNVALVLGRVPLVLQVASTNHLSRFEALHIPQYSNSSAGYWSHVNAIEFSYRSEDGVLFIKYSAGSIDAQHKNGCLYSL